MDTDIELAEELDLYAERAAEARTQQAQTYADNLVLRIQLRKAETRIMELENSLREANEKNRRLQQTVGMYQAHLKKRKTQLPTDAASGVPKGRPN